MARFTRTPSKPAVRREPHRLAETTQFGSRPLFGVVAVQTARITLALRSTGLSMNFFMESLILAQDERWRRA